MSARNHNNDAVALVFGPRWHALGGRVFIGAIGSVPSLATLFPEIYWETFPRRADLSNR
jgi:hypothetical protein